MTTPTNARIIHTDNTSTPVDVAYVGPEPELIDGEILVVDHWEASTDLEWRSGDRLAFTLGASQPCTVELVRTEQ